MTFSQRVKYFIKKYFVNSLRVVIWTFSGKPVPAPEKVKQLIVRSYGKKYGYKVLVETGTYWGEMIDAQKSFFKKLYSIELSEDLHKRASDRFKNDSNIKLLQGDSGVVLPQIIKELDEPAIFWLDAHYSSGVTAKGNLDCPIFAELDAIFAKNQNHVLLIDDARDFIGKNDYPTIDELKKYFEKKKMKYKFEVAHDIIRAEPI